MNLFFSIVNHGYTKIALNFIERWKALRINKEIFFVCLDEASYSILKNKVRCELNEEVKLSENLEVWLNDKYKDIVFRKLDVTKQFVEKHRDQYKYITYLDTDMWINKDFTDELHGILDKSDFDIIFQDGENYLINKDECCEINQENRLNKTRQCKSYCTGFMCINSNSTKVLDLFDYKKKEINLYSGNQDLINRKLELSNLNFYNIPKRLFPNFSDPEYFLTLSDYWMLHYTYLIGKEKISFMKKNNHWLI